MFDVNALGQVCLYFGAGICIGIAAIASGIAGGHTAGFTTKAMVRQPAVSDKLLQSMLISQAMRESSAIFALVVSMLLVFGGFLDTAVDYAKAFSFVAAGLAMGMGSLGPSLGMGYVGAEACEGIGRTPSQSMPVTTAMLLGQALSQTSSIFALVVALLVLYTVPSMSTDQSAFYQTMRSAALISAGLSVGIGTFGPGIGIGYVSGVANKMISRFREQSSIFMRTMFLGAAVTQSTAVYALVVSFLLIFID